MKYFIVGEIIKNNIQSKDNHKKLKIKLKHKSDYISQLKDMPDKEEIPIFKAG
jgi:hypothetical protein